MRASITLAGTMTGRGNANEYRWQVNTNWEVDEMAEIILTEQQRAPKWSMPYIACMFA